MKFKIQCYKTALYMAVENENIEIVKLLLSCDKLDINHGFVLNMYFYTIQNHYFLITCLNHIFQLHSKL